MAHVAVAVVVDDEVKESPEVTEQQQKKQKLQIEHSIAEFSYYLWRIIINNIMLIRYY